MQFRILDLVQQSDPSVECDNYPKRHSTRMLFHKHHRIQTTLAARHLPAVAANPASPEGSLEAVS
jgi:hypothetical protein